MRYAAHITRREALQLLVGGVLTLGLAACETGYERPYGELDLGEIGGLLYEKQFIRERAILLLRDDRGWSALSTRCGHEGCELTFQEASLLCMCCGSVFHHDGAIAKGPAKRPLPWFRVRFSDNHLYAVAGEEVQRSYRFTTPEIEDAIEKLRDRIREQGARPGARIPSILLGKGDGEPQRPIFQEEKPTTSTVP